MTKEFTVGLQDILIITEDISQASYTLSMLLCNGYYPIMHQSLVKIRQGDTALYHVVDFGHNNLAFGKRDTKITQ